MGDEMPDGQQYLQLSKAQEDRIVLQVIEKVLNLMPEVIGNLMSQQASNNTVRKEFYTKYPEFKDHADVVTAVIAGEEGKELGQDLDKVLAEAVPRIREQIKVKSEVNLTGVKSDRKNVDLNINMEDDSFGVL
jgi:hypothetical protein